MSEKHAHYLTNKTLLQKPVQIHLKTEANLPAPRCVAFAKHLASSLCSLPPPQAGLELACAPTCLLSHREVQQLPLHRSISCRLGTVPVIPCGPHLLPAICSLGKPSSWPLLCPSLGNIPGPLQGPIGSRPGGTGFREQPDGSLLPFQRS